MAKGSGRKLGRWKRKNSNLNYKNSNRRGINKYRRVLRSSGEKAARLWKEEFYLGRPNYLVRAKSSK